ncbi:MAG: HlyD family efflux transporter periplasmic adaptor subunit [Rubrivivax sp.]|nr:HlyD family efflux transporter periplasmic adaptor subunit [Rubrivivax sp.]
MRLLFRPEVAQARGQQWLGRVQLVRPLALHWLTAGVITLVVIVGAFLTLAQSTRKAQVAGVLMPDRGLIRLVPAINATVLERHVSEGQAVQAGALLFVLGVERSTLDAGVQARVQRSLDERQRSLRDAALRQQQLASTQAATLDRRLQALALEQAQIDTEAALQGQRIGLAQQALARLEALRADQFIASAQVQAKSEEVLGLQAQGQALVRQRAALARQRAELDGELRALPMLTQGVEGGITRDLAALSREAAEQDAPRQVVIRAPQAGTISALLAEPGQSVSAQSALASLVPAGATLQAHLYAPSSAVGFVRPGQAVRLRYEAYPHQKYGHQAGVVVQVSRTPLAAAELAALALPAVAAAGEPLFRITVALDAQLPSLPQAPVAGMRLQADVLLERRRLIEWLFEPLFGLAGRL